MDIEAIIYLLRKTNLTRKEIGKLTPEQFRAIIEEVSFQESREDYRTQYNVASLLAAITNTIPRKKGSKTYQAKDFLPEKAPTRPTKQSTDITQLAKEKGIKLPGERDD